MRIRQMIILFIFWASLLCGGAAFLFWRGERTEAAPGWPVPAALAVATDLHYISPELTDGGEYFAEVVKNGDGKAMPYCEEITDAFVAQIIERKPDALILTGDLTFNGARASHEALAAKLALIEEGGIPVLVIPGNHDLNNPLAASFQGDSHRVVESVSARQFADIYDDFGYREALGRDKASLSYVYDLSPGLRVLMVDVNTKDSPGVLADETLRWVKRQLKAAREEGVRVLAASHQNLMMHNPFFSNGYVMGNAEKLRDLYAEYGVLCNLSGHIHFQHIAASEDGVTEFVTSSLITSPCQYGILEVDSSETHYHAEQVGFPHAAEARQIFRDAARRMAAEALPDAGDGLYDLFADFSTMFFSGRLDSLSWDEALYEELCERYPFIGFYINSILKDGLRNHTESP